MKVSLIFLLPAAGLVCSTTSCSTARGFGQDLQKVGHRLENRAESTGGTVPETPSRGITTTTTTYSVPATPPPPVYTPPPISTTPPGY